MSVALAEQSWSQGRALFQEVVKIIGCEGSEKCVWLKSTGMCLWLKLRFLTYRKCWREEVGKGGLVLHE